MGEESNQIVYEIEQKRAELGSNLRELEDKVRHIADWRWRFRRSPWAMLGVAFGVGVALSTVVKKKKFAADKRR